MFVQMYKERFMLFPEGRRKALTFSYDDGVSADLRLLKIFAENGLKGTFNLNSGLFDCPEWHGRLNEEQTYSAFSKTDCEIALHGERHIFMTKVSLPEAVAEIAKNRLYLEGKFKKVVNGLAYAYDSHSEEIRSALKSVGVVYGRTTKSTGEFSLPSDWMQWNPTCHHNKLAEYSEKFLSVSPESSLKCRDSLLFYVWGHSYEFDDNNNWDIIENFAKEVRGNKNIWFCTNGEVYNYVTAFKSLVFSLEGEIVFNPSHLDVWFEQRGKIYLVKSGETLKI